MFCACKSYILKQMQKPEAVYYTVIKHSGHLRTLDNCRKHSPAARVFYVSLVFSNDHRVLSQCNTRLRLLYLLNNVWRISLGLRRRGRKPLWKWVSQYLFLNITFRLMLIFNWSLQCRPLCLSLCGSQSTNILYRSAWVTHVCLAWFEFRNPSKFLYSLARKEAKVNRNFDN